MVRLALQFSESFKSWMMDKATHFRDCLKIVEQAQWKKQEELQNTQLKLIQTLLDYSSKRIPYYADLFRRVGFKPARIKQIDDITEIPISTKPTLRRVYPQSIYVKSNWLDMTSRTSGSAGDPLESMIDGKTHGWHIANELLFDSWMGIKPWEPWLRISSHSGLMDSIRARILNSEIVVPIELTTRTKFSKLIAEIDHHRPAGLLGFPSSLALLAYHMRESGHRLKHVLKGVVGSGETFPSYQKRLVREVLSENIYDRYGLTEFGGHLAQDCERHVGLHINPLLVHVEVVKNGEPAKPGETGTLLLTDLRNYAMPLIRYDTGDIGSVHYGCECGRSFPVLRDLSGRVNEYMLTRLGELPAVAVTVKFGLGFEKEIRDFQFLQLADGAVDLKIVPRTACGKDLKDRITKFLNTYLEDFEIENVQQINSEPSGKKPSFKSMRQKPNDVFS